MLKIEFEIKPKCAKCGSDLEMKLQRIHPGPTLTIAVSPCPVCLKGESNEKQTPKLSATN